jgi:spore germination cell wall hydrolase CwlJ-like protein
MLETHRQILCMTLTIYGEVGEVKNNQEDVKAVANVIMNRVKSDHPYFPDTVCQVVLKKNQFEPLAEGKRLRYHTLLAINDLINFRIPRYIDKNTFWRIYNVSMLAYHGHLQDNTNGAIGFYAPKAQKRLGRNKPAFTKKLQLVAMVGEQEYYR